MSNVKADDLAQWYMSSGKMTNVELMDYLVLETEEEKRAYLTKTIKHE